MRTANQGTSSADYEAFIRLQARGGGGRREPSPATLDGWDRRLAVGARGDCGDRSGECPGHPCPLDPETLGVLNRDGYAIERLTFQSRPGVRVTANLYRPDPIRGQYPGVISVHGHWSWARVDPHVQPRCIGLARLGYVVLCLDAFGAGERAIEPGPGTYHGGLVGASLWPVGTPLIGLASLRQPPRRRLPGLATGGRRGETGDHRGVRRRQPVVLRGRDRRTPVSRDPGLRHRDLRRLSHDRLLRLRAQSRRGVLRHDRRPAGHGRSSRPDGHQRHSRRTSVQRRRGRQEHRLCPGAVSTHGP